MSFNPLSAEDHAAVLEDITIRFDRRATMEALKAKMAELISIPVDQFKVITCRGGGCLVLVRAHCI